MGTLIDGPPDPGEPPPPWRVRLAWFTGLALASGGATALIAYGLKALLPS